MNAFAPIYISSLIKIKQPSNYGLRSNNELLLHNHWNEETLGDRVFARAAPKLWSGLPSSVGNANN